MATQTTGEDAAEREALLASSFLFEALDAKGRRELAGHARIQHFAAGSAIFRAGTPGYSVMAIAAGTVRISLLTPNAREVVLAELGKGDVFGEVALLDGGERSADATAVTNCRLVVLDRRWVLALLESEPKLAIGLVELLCARIRRSDARMLEFSFLDLPARLARTLIRATTPPAGSDARPIAKLALSQTVLANMVGGARENVNRCLRNWQRAGVVELKGGWLIVLDRAALEALCEPAG
jgi:CRP-like cAMP-binding protein